MTPSEPDRSICNKYSNQKSTIQYSHFVAISTFKVLSSGRQKWLQLLESISTREEAVAGGVAMAAGFATYLGPYSFKFRRDMLTVHWPQCLDERGVMLVVDSSGQYAGAEVFMMEQLQNVRINSAAEGEQEVAGEKVDENGNEEESKEKDEQNGKTHSFKEVTEPIRRLKEYNSCFYYITYYVTY